MGFENGKLLRVVLRATTGTTEEAVTVLHYDLDDAGILSTPNDPQQLADDFRDDVVGSFAALFKSAWSVQPVVVEQEKDPQNPTATRSAWTSGTPAVGTLFGGGDQLPPAVCAVAALKTAHIGRRFTGRIFVPGDYAEGDQDDGIFNTDCLARIQTFLDAIPHQPDLASGASSASANWCVYSRTQRAANLDPYAPPITSALLRHSVHWLRSRER